MRLSKLSARTVKSAGEETSGVSRKALGAQSTRLYLAQRDVSGVPVAPREAPLIHRNQVLMLVSSMPPSG